MNQRPKSFGYAEVFLSFDDVGSHGVDRKEIHFARVGGTAPGCEGFQVGGAAPSGDAPGNALDGAKILGIHFLGKGKIDGFSVQCALNENFFATEHDVGVILGHGFDETGYFVCPQQRGDAVNLHEVVAFVHLQEFRNVLFAGGLARSQVLRAFVESSVLLFGNRSEIFVFRVEPDLVENSGFSAFADGSRDQGHTS